MNGWGEMSTGSRQKIAAYIEAVRPRHWLKNLLVFVPMFAAHDFSTKTCLLSLNAFLSFSLVASVVYILNDLNDLTADRKHTRKRYRPIASGRVTVLSSSILAGIILVLAGISATWLGTQFLGVILLYFLLTLTYTTLFKKIAYLDLGILTCLYLFRLIAGGQATEIPLSGWLLTFAGALFLSLAATKRHAELVDVFSKDDHIRLVGRGYRLKDRPMVAALGMLAGYASVLILALYFMSQTVAQLYDSPIWLWGICGILIYWNHRVYTITSSGKMHDDPVVFATTDTKSLICFGLVVLLIFCAMLL